MCRNWASRSGWLVPSSVLRLAWQAVAQSCEQLGHRLVADRMALSAELRGEVADAPRRPAQRGLGVTPGGRLDERLEVGPQRRVALLDGWPSGTRPPDPPALEPLARPDVVHAARDGRAREAGRPGHRRHPAPADGQRLGPAISRRARSSSSGETARYRAAMAVSSITHRSYHICN